MGRLVSCTTLLGLCVACVALDVAAAVEVCGHDRSVPARIALVLDATHLPVAGVLAAFSDTCTPISSGALAITIIAWVFPPVIGICIWSGIGCAKEMDVDVGDVRCGSGVVLVGTARSSHH